jgi:hypothetical protein
LKTPAPTGLWRACTEYEPHPELNGPV